MNKSKISLLVWLVLVGLYVIVLIVTTAPAKAESDKHVLKLQSKLFTPIPPAIQEIRCNNKMKSWVIFSNDITSLRGLPGRMMSDEHLARFICKVWVNHPTIYYTEICSTVAYQSETMPDMKPAVDLMNRCFGS